jgi:hypothetical protein
MKTLPLKEWSLNKLPIGYFFQGEILREFTYHGMRGKDRAAFLNQQSVQQPFRIIDQVCQGCLESIGPIREISGDLVKSLSSKDREFIIFSIALASSLEKELQLQHDCSKCKTKLDIFVNPLDFDVRVMEESDTEIFENQRVLHLQNEKLDAILKIPNGFTQEKVAEASKSNAFDLDCVIFSDIVLKLNGEEGPFSIEFFENQPIYVLDELALFLNDFEAGLDLGLEVECDNCKNVDELEVGIHNFLFLSHMKRLSRLSKKKFFI